MYRFFRRLASEPLVQFLLLGFIVFAIDHYVFVNSDNPRRISVGDDRYLELVSIFEDERGRPPSDDEIDDMLIAWTQNEVLYREALSMGLDRGDEMIRSRMVLKIRDVVFNNVIVDVPADDGLEAWFEANRSAYDRPELIDFEQFPVNDLDESSASTLAVELGEGEVPEEYESLSRLYRDRIEGNLFSVFDSDGAQAIVDAPLGHWRVARSDRGLHLSRITRRLPGEKVDFQEVRALVKDDWESFERERQIAEALREIVDQYEIRYDFSQDVLRKSLAAYSAEPGTTSK